MNNANVRAALASRKQPPSRIAKIGGIEVAANDTIDDVGNKLAAEINKSNLFVAQYVGKAIVIKPAMKGASRTWAGLNYVTTTFNGAPDPALTGPSVSFAKIVDVTGNITP